MSPKELVQDTVQHNKRLNLAWKLLKASKRSKPTLPFRLASSKAPGMLTRASDPVARGHVTPSAASTKPRTSKRPRNSKPVFEILNFALTSYAMIGNNLALSYKKLVCYYKDKI